MTFTTICYAIGDYDNARLLVASTANGVCAVLPGDRDALLEQELPARFPGYSFATETPSAHPFWQSVVDTLKGERAGEPALEFLGTAFQRRVWQALRRIPAGTTTSYAALARTLEMPRAARAVAQACARNPLAVLVPCHRVVRSDGGLSGYRWGVQRKRSLLEREGCAVATA